MKKRILSLVLALSLCVSLLVAPVSAADIIDIPSIAWNDNIWRAWDDFFGASSSDNYSTNICNSTFARSNYSAYTYSSVENLVLSLNTSSDTSGYYFDLQQVENTAYFGIRVFYRIGVFGNGRSLDDKYASSVLAWVCDNSNRAIFCTSDVSTIATKSIPRSQAAAAGAYRMLSYEDLYNLAYDYNSQHNYNLALNSDGVYWAISSRGDYVLANESGLPYGAVGPSAVNGNGNERPLVNSDVIGDTIMNWSNNTVGDADGGIINFDGAIYDSNNKTYYIDAHQETTNNYYNYSYTYNISHTTITYIGSSAEYTEQYECYYQLPDGRSSADLTNEELEQLNLNIDVVPYDRTTEDTSLWSLYHFDGNTRDSSYWNYRSRFKWNSGASITYLDAGNFNGCLYLDEKTHDFELEMPSMIGNHYFVLEFRYYQSATETPVNDSYVNVGGEKLLRFDGNSMMNGSNTVLADMPVGSWVSIALCRNTLGKLYYYMNGVCVGSASNSTNFNNKITFHFGNEQQTYKYLDEIRVLQSRSDKTHLNRGANYTPAVVPFDTNLSLVLPDTGSYIDSRYPHNENLLTNWYFGNPVNQRGITSLSSQLSSEFIDFWGKYDYGTLSLQDDSLVITNTNNQVWFNYLDHSGLASSLAGKTITISCIVDSFTGLWVPYSNILCPYNPQFGYPLNPGLNSWTFTVPSDIESSLFILSFASIGVEGTYLSLKAVKLELGSEQTLAHQEGDKWVLNEIPSYREQLEKCRQYYAPDGLVADEWVSVDCSCLNLVDGDFRSAAPSIDSLNKTTATIGYHDITYFSDACTSPFAKGSDISITSVDGLCRIQNNGNTFSPSDDASNANALFIPFGNNGGYLYNRGDYTPGIYTMTVVFADGSSAFISSDLSFFTAHLTGSISNALRMTSSQQSFSWGKIGVGDSLYPAHCNLFSGTVTYRSSQCGFYIAPDQGKSVDIAYIVLEKASSSSVSASLNSALVNVDMDAFTPTLAVRTDIGITKKQFGGVRPILPGRGDVYAMVENGFITSLQQYDGQAWVQVDGRIWTGQRWVPYSSYNVITLSDMYDIADASGQGGYEYIYSESGFWSWWQKQWLEFKQWYSGINIGGGSGGDTNINVPIIAPDIDAEWDFSNDDLSFGALLVDLPKTAFSTASGLLKVVGNTLKNVPLALNTFVVQGNPLNPAGAFKVFIIPGT